MDSTSSPRHTGARVLLGIFILGQLFFLLAANLIDVIQTALPEPPDQAKEVVNVLAPGLPDKKGHVQDTFDVVTSVTKRWGQATGQVQSWSLFAPEVGSEITFVAVQFRRDEDPLSAPSVGRRLLPLAANDCFSGVLLWAEAMRVATPTLPQDRETVYRQSALLACSNVLETVCLCVAADESKALMPNDALANADQDLFLSDNEPEDIERYFRWGRFRLRRFEGNLDVILAPRKNEPLETRMERWRSRIEEHVRKEHDTIKVYLQWRLK